MPRIASLLLFPALLASSAWSQTAAPCAAGSSTVAGYRSNPLPNSFSSILGLPGTVPVFGVGADDQIASVVFPGGFSFQFYGSARSLIVVGSNGYVTFDTSAAPTGRNEHIDHPAGPEEAIFVWHDDLVLTEAGAEVAARFDMTSGAESLTLEWYRVSNAVAPATGLGSMGFQVILYASTHATKANRIELRYDRSASPPVMAGCSTDNPSVFSTSATVGVEGLHSSTTAAQLGHDPTERGAANQQFPPADLALIATTFSQPSTGLSVEKLPGLFCHRDEHPDTVFLPANCGDVCYGDTPSSKLTGEPIAIPWKFNLMGRHVRSFVMNSNGFLQLGAGTADGYPNNAGLPSAAAPNAVVAPFWDDLEGNRKSEMQYRVVGLPGCRVISAEWHQAHDSVAPEEDCATGGGAVSMQAKLFEAGAGTPVASGGSKKPCPFDDVLLGNGDDRIEFTYDAGIFVFGNFSATIGVESTTGGVGLEGEPGSSLTAPDLDKLYRFRQCDFGTVRYYGDGSTNIPGGCIPEMQTNGVPPVIGNPFGLRVVHASPGFAAALLIDSQPAPAGQSIPCPCGGIPTAFGTFWVDLFGSAQVAAFNAGAVAGSAACSGSASIDFVLPNLGSLVGVTVFAQWFNFQVQGANLLVELSEGAKITVGG